MMPRLLLCLTMALLVASCAGNNQLLPKLAPTSDGTGLEQRCAALFPRRSWQLVHTIAFRMADGASGNAIGVLILNDQEIRCALMTVEGLTLFEARSSGLEEVEVLRALPPFDHREFAAGLMRDVRTLFLPPLGTSQFGSLDDGSPLCRYTSGNTVTDILPQSDGCWRMHTYSEQTSPRSAHQEQHRTRTIEARFCNPVGAMVLPHALTLIAAGPAGYTLNLRLISAEPLATTTLPLP
jgi:hypothetical protein